MLQCFQLGHGCCLLLPARCSFPNCPLLSRPLPCPALPSLSDSFLQNEKVLLILNETNDKVYLSGRNVPTLAINTANAVQVRACVMGRAPAAGCSCSCPLGQCQVGSLLAGVSARSVSILYATRLKKLTPLFFTVLCQLAMSLCPPHRLGRLHPRPPLQVYDVLNADRIIVEQAALAYINEWFGAEA